MAGRQHGLLERDADLQRLAQLMQPIGENQGALVAIEGPAGIGKTALIDAGAAQAAARGLRVLHARGGELEAGHPFGLVRQLFEPVLHAMTGDERDRLLSGPASAAAAALGLEREAVDAQGLDVLHGLHHVCVRLSAETPLMLAIDDAHWSDPATLRWLVFLAARIKHMPVALVIATRPPEHAEQSGLLVRLLADPAVATLRPGELSENAVSQLVSECWSQPADPQFVAACHEATGGNPFLVRELLAASRREGIAPVRAQARAVRRLGPTSISRSMLLRLGSLTESARAVAKAVAVLGTQVPLVHAAALADLSAQEATQAADALAAAGILAPTRPLEFLHPIIRTAAYGELSAGERSRQHARAADLLKRAGAAAGEVAVHLTEIEPAGDPVIVERLRAAATCAVARGSPDGAVRFLERALAEPPPSAERGQLLFELGCARSRAGYATATAALREALELAAGARRRAEILLELLPLLDTTLLTDEMSALLQSTTDELDPVSDRELLLTLEAFERVRDPQREAARLERYRDLPGETHAERILLVTLARRHTESVSTSAAAAAELAIRALDRIGDLPMGTRSEVDLTGSVGFTLLACDRAELVHPMIDRWLQDARRLGLQHWLAPAVAWQGICAWFNGDLPAAETLLLQSLQMSRGLTPTFAGPFLTLVRLSRGEKAGAELALKAGAELALTLVEPHLDKESWHVSRAELKLSDGDDQAAVEELLAFGAMLEQFGHRTVDVPYNWRAIIAPPLARLGRIEEARDVLDVGLQRARTWGVPRAIGKLLHACGLVEQTAGNGGLATFEAAVDALARSAARLDLATASVDLGAALRRANRRADARPHLRAGLELAHACDAQPLADRARQELQATGARLRSRVVTGVDSLTPSERRIAGMAADGLSNAEIAHALFVTVKTVETHLGHAYRKLDIRSRWELRAALEPQE